LYRFLIFLDAKKHIFFLYLNNNLAEKEKNRKKNLLKNDKFSINKKYFFSLKKK